MAEISDLFENELDLGFTQNNQPAPVQQLQNNGVQQGQTLDEFLANPIVPKVQPAQSAQENPINIDPLGDLKQASETIANLNAQVGNPITEEDDGEDWLDIISKDATRFKEIPENKLTKEICMAAVSKSGYLLANVPEKYLDNDVISRAITTSPEIIVQVHKINARTEDEWLNALYKQPSLIKQLPDDMATSNILNNFHNKFKGTQWDTYILEKYIDRRQDTQHKNQQQVQSVQQAQLIKQPEPVQQPQQVQSIQQTNGIQIDINKKGEIINKMAILSGLMLSLERTQDEIKKMIDDVYKEIREM